MLLLQHAFFLVPPLCVLSVAAVVVTHGQLSKSMTPTSGDERAMRRERERGRERERERRCARERERNMYREQERVKK